MAGQVTEIMKVNWQQSGMPVTLVSRLGARNEYAEFKSVLRDAQNQVMTPVDAESMARELAESGGREYVEVVRELTTALEGAKRELAAANWRYERLVSNLERRGIPLEEMRSTPAETPVEAPAERPVAAGRDEWDEWNRKFQSLLG